MKHVILRYGLIGALILIGLNVAVLILLGIPDADDYALGEVIGYSSIFVALVPVFFWIKQYRDEVGGGALSFWKGIGVGVAIATVPSVAFAVYNLVYVKVIDPDFSEKYMQYSLDSARADMSADEFERYASQLEAQSAMLTDPLFQTVLMFLTVFLIGVVVAILSSIILRQTPATVSTP